MKTLADLSSERAFEASHLANLRMQLWFTGETHRLLGEAQTEITRAVMQAANADGALDGLGLYRAQKQLEVSWNRTIAAWKKTFADLREMAAMLPFGALAVLHREYVLAAMPAAKLERVWQDARHGVSLREQEPLLDYLFSPQLQAIVDAAARRIYGDGLQLSQRIWRLDVQSQEGMRQILYNGMLNGESAWNIAKELERYLGAGADCPRWTRSRLNRLTKADIADGDPTGLVRGDACAGQGVAYNALRLARNEIQMVHAMATDAMLERLPWIEKEEVRLSPDHAERDECDAVAGEHPKGTVLLPIHVHCLCYKVAVLIKPKEFTTRLRDWLNGTAPWREMDQYAASLGGNLDVNLGETRAAQMLLPWFSGSWTVLMQLMG